MNVKLKTSPSAAPIPAVQKVRFVDSRNAGDRLDRGRGTTPHSSSLILHANPVATSFGVALHQQVVRAMQEAVTPLMIATFMQNLSIRS